MSATGPSWPLHTELQGPLDAGDRECAIRKGFGGNATAIGGGFGGFVSNELVTRGMHPVASRRLRRLRRPVARQRPAIRIRRFPRRYRFAGPDGLHRGRNRSFVVALAIGAAITLGCAALFQFMMTTVIEEPEPEKYAHAAT